jgi:hypothetical protein
MNPANEVGESLDIEMFGELGKPDGYSTTTLDQLDFRYAGAEFVAITLNE